MDRINSKSKKNIYITLFTAVFAVIWMVPGSSRSQGLYEQSINENVRVDQIVPEGWMSLFDGETLSGWEIVRYGGEGEPYVRNGVLVLPRTSTGIMTGVRWVGDPLPVSDYIFYYEARRVEGKDIFAALSFPYGDTQASLIIGGWGGVVNGISSIDGYDASENETTQLFSLDDNEWHQMELRVTADSICALLDYEPLVDLATTGKDIHLRGDLLDTGLTLWTFNSTGEIRNIRIKVLDRTYSPIISLIYLNLELEKLKFEKK